jgi:hypothetical protein
MLFLLVGQNATAESDTSGPVTRPLFTSDSTLAITIEAPLKTIMRNRDETEEFPATLKYAGADGTEHQLDIKLRVRGKFRLQRRICNFVPLRVNFRKKQVEGTVFAGQDKIKLVTDCQRATPKYQQLLLKEYLAYKIFNMLTDRSFGARLLRVTYIDSEQKGKTRNSYAFFIEEKKHIAERLGMELVKIERTKYSSLDPARTNLVNIYEYLIGNTDFSLVAGPDETNCCHNAVIYQKGDDPYTSIPYDFDHAGIVNAPYAEPNPRFRIKSVKKRVYRGRCANNAYLDSTLQQFLAKRDDITQLIEGLEGFDARSIKGTRAYVDGFYRVISDPKSTQIRIINKCS